MHKQRTHERWVGTPTWAATGVRLREGHRFCRVAGRSPAEKMAIFDPKWAKFEPFYGKEGVGERGALIS